LPDNASDSIQIDSSSTSG